jgi:hypothetical protein
MKPLGWFLALTFLATVAANASARATLPLVDEIDFKLFRDDCGRLLKVLEERKAPLPEGTVKAIKAALKKRTKDSKAAITDVQKLLDRYCLIGVTINPESRVKVERGPAVAQLGLNREAILLIKIQNQAGVTHALKVTSPQFRSKGHAADGQWLEAGIHTEPPLRKTLSGHAVEYVILRLTAREAGKREATLRFDVGQGTQDLGFRAEVPVLFTVRAARNR